jgi:hypothetical protein
MTRAVMDEELSIVRLPCDGPEQALRVVLQGIRELQRAANPPIVVVPESMSGGPPNPRDLLAVANEGLVPGVDLDCCWTTGDGLWVSGFEDVVMHRLDWSDLGAAKRLAVLISATSPLRSSGMATRWITAIVQNDVRPTRDVWDITAAGLFLDRVLDALEVPPRS